MTEVQSYFNDIKDIPLLSEDEEVAFAISRNKEELVQHNLRFAASIAKQYQNRGIPLEDLIQEANIGLMKAADKYDVSTGFRFTTYASYWIKQSLSKAIEKNGNVIRIPAHVISKRNKIEGFCADCFEKNGVYPSEEEMSKNLNFSIEEIRRIRSYFLDLKSIDDTFGEEDDTIGSTIADSSIELPCEETFRQVDKETVNLVLDTISPRERKVIELRIMQNKSLEETGKILDITAERVRQIEAKALRKLRHPARARILRSIIL